MNTPLQPRVSERRGAVLGRSQSLLDTWEQATHRVPPGSRWLGGWGARCPGRVMTGVGSEPRPRRVQRLRPARLQVPAETPHPSRQKHRQQVPSCNTRAVPQRRSRCPPPPASARPQAHCRRGLAAGPRLEHPHPPAVTEHSARPVLVKCGVRGTRRGRGTSSLLPPSAQYLVQAPRRCRTEPGGRRSRGGASERGR